MKAIAKPSASWTWKSILEGRKVLEGGIRWQVGCGNLICATEDPWLPRDNGFVPRGIADFARGFRVNQFIQSNGIGWKEDLVREAFSSDEAELVLGIPLSRFPRRDRVLWHFTGNGVYTAKSG